MRPACKAPHSCALSRRLLFFQHYEWMLQYESSKEIRVDSKDFMLVSH